MAGKKHITSRDIKVIDFLEKTNLLITAEQASRFFYQSPSGNKKSAITVAQRRLGVAYELKQINRFRDHIDQSFVYYYKKKPTKVDHKLLMTEFIINFEKDFEIINIKSEYKDLEEQYGIRPDLYIEFKFGTKTLIALVECDNTKGFTSGDSYVQILSDKRAGKLKEILPYPITVISCCKTKPQHPLNPIWVNSDFTDFSKIKYTLIRLEESRTKKSAK